MVTTRPTTSGVAGLDADAVHSYASGTKSKVSVVDVTTLTGQVNVIYV